MSAHPRSVARNTISREKERRRAWREHPATKYAFRIGKVVCDRLRQCIKKGTTLKKAILQALRQEGFSNCSVRIAKGEVHVFIGPLRDELHGHVIVAIRRKIARYHRGYNMSHGPWNHRR